MSKNKSKNKGGGKDGVRADNRKQQQKQTGASRSHVAAASANGDRDASVSASSRLVVSGDNDDHLLMSNGTAAAAADDDDDMDLAAIDEEGPDEDELAIACEVLEWVVKEAPEVLSVGGAAAAANNGSAKGGAGRGGGNRYKRLKRAGWAFGKLLQEVAAAGGAGGGAGGVAQGTPSIHARVSHLLSLSLYSEALVALFEMHTLRIAPKLGALQRWVRECDATARPEVQLSDEERQDRQTVLRCLDMVLRVCGGQPSPTRGTLATVLEDNTDGEESRDGVVQRVRPWRVRNDVVDKMSPPSPAQDAEPLWDLIQRGVTQSPASAADNGFRIVQRTPGAERRPPNVYPCTVWASDAQVSPVPFADLPSSALGEVTPLSHPLIPTCRMLLNVLPTSTCRTIIEQANALGWEPDQAAGGSAVDKTSVLAHNVVWLADESFVGKLFERIKPFVEERVNGGKVRGVNRRFRVYRYGARQVYRPHIDGAWPAAGLDDDDNYLHDSSPSDDPLWSRYTLLIYLNEDINATPTAPRVPGATTFFLPHPSSIGTLLACPIAPVQGAVLVFPHGDAKGSLLHEGSPVGDGGWKCVIRTDLLYEAQGFGEFAPGAKQRKQGQVAKRQREVVDNGDDDRSAVSKVARVIDEKSGTKKVVVLPKAVGSQNLGDGEEGAGG